MRSLRFRKVSSKTKYSQLDLLVLGLLRWKIRQIEIFKNRFLWKNISASKIRIKSFFVYEQNEEVAQFCNEGLKVKDNLLNKYGKVS